MLQYELWVMTLAVVRDIAQEHRGSRTAPLLFIPLRGGAAAGRHMVGQQTDPLAPAAGRGRRFSLYVMLSLRHFGPARCCSLSLRGWGAPPHLTRRLLDRREPPIFLQKGHRNRGEFSGKAKVGQALEQTICLLLL